MSAHVQMVTEDDLIEVEDPQLAKYSSEVRVFREMLSLVGDGTDGSVLVLHDPSFQENMKKTMDHSYTAAVLDNIAHVLKDTDFHSLPHCEGRACSSDKTTSQCRRDCLKGIAAGVHKTAEIVCRDIFTIENYHTMPTSKVTMNATLTGMDLKGVGSYLPVFPLIRQNGRSPLEDAWAAFYGSVLGATVESVAIQHHGNLHASLDVAIPFSIFLHEAAKVVKEMKSVHSKKKDIESSLSTLPEKMASILARLDALERKQGMSSKK